MGSTATLFSGAAKPLGRLVRVALPRAIDRPSGLLYSLPDSIAELRIGDSVRVPLGRGDSTARGWVIEVIDRAKAGAILEAEGLDSGRLKSISRAEADRDEGSLPSNLVDLARWMSSYYCCPIGMTLAAMIPSAVMRGVGRVRRMKVRRVALTEQEVERRVESLSPTARQAWDSLVGLGSGGDSVEARALAHELGLRTVAPVNRLVRAGLLEEVGVVEVRSRSGEAAPESGDPDATRPELTRAQSDAVDAVARALGGFGGFLLFGVTGSGKTEVYLRVLEAALDRGEGAIVLVPEISLTPQTVSRFVDRLAPRGERIAVLHSGLTSAQRHREWLRVRKGEARIVIGARSAIFAPIGGECGRLGLIIVDEEHDGSYKQDQLPRYHARDVALRRGQLEGCPVVLGSATPSLESWHNALRAGEGGSGRFALLELPERVGGGVLPRVDIVDLKEEERASRRESHELRALGPTLAGALERTLAHDGAQAILLLNRRGYASYVCCADQSCGWFMTCEHCDVTVVHHRAGESKRGVVRCHHCQVEQKLPELCPRCGKRVNTYGFGTQRLECELERRFPSLRSGETLMRVDADTMRRSSDYFEALDRFGRGEIRVLMGTQMISKGLDYPNVELIGVINADTALHMPDFRSAERTFQLVAQVAGRAGRSAQSVQRSRVIVQTMNPAEPAIVLASRHDFASFAKRELGFRREVGLPPVGRMARVVCRDVLSERAEARARELASAAREMTGESVRVKGPMPCALARIAGQHRWGVELLGDSAVAIQETLTALRGRGLVRSDARTAVDVDPVALL